VPRPPAAPSPPSLFTTPPADVAPAPAPASDAAAAAAVPLLLLLVPPDAVVRRGLTKPRDRPGPLQLTALAAGRAPAGTAASHDTASNA
jgi:hypothetical protein